MDEAIERSPQYTENSSPGPDTSDRPDTSDDPSRSDGSDMTDDPSMSDDGAGSRVCTVSFSLGGIDEGPALSPNFVSLPPLPSVPGGGW